MTLKLIGLPCLMTAFTSRASVLKQLLLSWYGRKVLMKHDVNMINCFSHNCYCLCVHIVANMSICFTYSSSDLIKVFLLPMSSSLMALAPLVKARWR